MIACIGSTNVWGVLSSLSSCSEGVSTNSICCCGKSRKCLEIQPQLTHIIRNLADGVGTSPSTGSGVGAGVVWVSDVGGVGGDGGAAGGGRDYT